MAAAIDLQQQVWPAAFLDALARREAGPRARRRDDGTWVVRGDGGVVVELGERELCLHRRSGALFAAGIDRALFVPPLELGIDALPDGEGRRLLDAWLAGALDAGSRFGAWAGIARDAPTSDVTAALRRGAVGLAVAADLLVDADAFDRASSVLDALARAGRPLLVHGGRGGDGDLRRAWRAWVGHGAGARPTLRVAFAALAGGAPVAEPAGDVADRTFYLTSHAAPSAIADAVGAVGIDRVAFGSGRPAVPATAQHVPPVRGVEEGALVRDAAAAVLATRVARAADAGVVPDRAWASTGPVAMAA
ncbi:MAG: hypothetical protein M0P31_14285 [Solirubrobacteraceae bacterium]|nr:hypothetical protein [Solirubrobacteraceae bacterium]